MEYKHFSHQHTLNLYKVQDGQQYLCHGCQSLCHDSIYACWKCNFFLHEHCGNANRYVKHPFHPLHPLVLMPTPTYCSGSFLCNACGAPGSTFSYCCALCELDLHPHCAFLPPKVSHRSHQHELSISLGVTDQKELPDYCKICVKQLNSKLWSYVCAEGDCDFRVHTFCATTEVKPGLYHMNELDSDISVATSSDANNQGGSQSNLVEEEQVLTPEDLESIQLIMQMNQMLASFKLAN